MAEVIVLASVRVAMAGSAQQAEALLRIVERHVATWAGWRDDVGKGMEGVQGREREQI